MEKSIPSSLKKLRARIMYALCPSEDNKIKTYAKGNHTITLRSDLFTFWYRGTAIAQYSLKDRKMVTIHAGTYEGTVATEKQREAILEAIIEFESVVK